MGRARAWPLLAALAVVVTVEAQITEPGICPFSTPLADWDEERFVAEPWYEMKALALPGLHDADPRPGCTRWHFAPSGDGQGLHARLAYRAREGDAVIRAFAQYTASERHPRFNLTFHDLGGPGSARSVDMKLVATDYADFALLWGCSEPNLFDRKVVSWVLSRRPWLSAAAQEALRGLFRRHDIRAERLVGTAHDAATCGPDGPADVTALPVDWAGPGSGSLFAAYQKAPTAEDKQRPGQEGGSSSAQGPPELAADSGVSWSYLGAADGAGGAGGAAGWPEGALLAALLALAAVSLVASLLTFRALALRLQSHAKPVLPVHRQDVVVATLGAGVDYSRFGGLGQGLTRKHVAEPGTQSA